MSLPFDIITFDCYGTLVDWRAGIVGAFRDIGRARGWAVDPDEVLRLHAEIEPALQQQRYRSYRHILIEVARETAHRLGWEMEDEDETFLADSLPHWPLFDDTNMTLRALKEEGYRLGILSNIDNALLAHTRRQFDVEFDLLVTAEDVRAYKPSTDHFERARQLIGGNRWLHAAQSYFHDVEPATRLGVSALWVNRLDEPPAGVVVPRGEVSDLRGVVQWLAARPPRRARPGQEMRVSGEEFVV